MISILPCELGLSFHISEGSWGMFSINQDVFSLQWRGFWLVITYESGGRSLLIGGHFESTYHLLLCFRFAWALWELAFSCLDISWVASKSTMNHLSAWEGFFGRKVKKKKKAMVVPHVNFGGFGEWIRILFEGVGTPLLCLKDNFIKMLFLG